MSASGTVRGFVAGLALLVFGTDTRVCFSQQDDSLELLGTLRIPGDDRDQSGDAKLLENGEPRNRLGGFSALDYSPSLGLFAALSDRGPDDGAVGYPCRVQMFEITIRPGQTVPIEARNVSTIFFTDSRGKQFTGLSSVIESTDQIGHRFDPEGFRFGPDNTMFVSDEYGPFLMQFSADGREMKRFVLPGHLLVQNPHGDKKKENKGNNSGRASNRGMECLAISTDGRKLVGLMQSPLIQDGERTDEGIISGKNCRLVEVDTDTGKIREFVYQMASVENGNSEIVAIGPEEYLVLERDGVAGEQSEYRSLVKISLAGATNVAGRTSLPTGDDLGEIVPVTRQVWLNFLDPRWRLAGSSMPEKIEGLTFGPELSDGRRSLLVGTDNDFESENDSLIWVFAIQ